MLIKEKQNKILKVQKMISRICFELQELQISKFTSYGKTIEFRNLPEMSF